MDIIPNVKNESKEKGRNKELLRLRRTNTDLGHTILELRKLALQERKGSFVSPEIISSFLKQEFFKIFSERPPLHKKPSWYTKKPNAPIKRIMNKIPLRFPSFNQTPILSRLEEFLKEPVDPENENSSLKRKENYTIVLDLFQGFKWVELEKPKKSLPHIIKKIAKKEANPRTVEALHEILNVFIRLQYGIEKGFESNDLNDKICQLYSEIIQNETCKNILNTHSTLRKKFFQCIFQGSFSPLINNSKALKSFSDSTMSDLEKLERFIASHQLSVLKKMINPHYTAEKIFNDLKEIAYRKGIIKKTEDFHEDCINYLESSDLETILKEAINDYSSEEILKTLYIYDLFGSETEKEKNIYLIKLLLKREKVLFPSSHLHLVNLHEVQEYSSNSIKILLKAAADASKNAKKYIKKLKSDISSQERNNFLFSKAKKELFLSKSFEWIIKPHKDRTISKAPTENNLPKTAEEKIATLDKALEYFRDLDYRSSLNIVLQKSLLPFCKQSLFYKEVLKSLCMRTLFILGEKERISEEERDNYLEKIANIMKESHTENIISFETRLKTLHPILKELSHITSTKKKKVVEDLIIEA